MPGLVHCVVVALLSVNLVFGTTVSIVIVEGKWVAEQAEPLNAEELDMQSSDFHLCN